MTTHRASCDRLTAFCTGGLTMPIGVYVRRGGWTEDRVEELRSHIAAGLSSGQIAALMECTREAVCGKAHRLGLKLREGSHNPGAVRTRRTNPRPGAEPPQKREPAWVERSSPDGALASMLAQLDVARVSSIVDLEPHHCKYPIGEPLAGFCGSKRVEGLPYCETHSARCYRPMVPGSRSITNPPTYNVVAFASVRAGTDVKEDA